MALVTATKENFEEIIQQDGVVVEFWAPWCGYCKRLAPVIKALANQHDELVIAQVNIDELEDVSDRYGIETIPSLLVFHNGIPSEALVAPQAKADIVDWLKAEKAVG